MGAMGQRFQFSVRGLLATVSVAAVAVWFVMLTGPLGVCLLIASAYVVIGAMHA